MGAAGAAAAADTERWSRQIDESTQWLADNWHLVALTYPQRGGLPRLIARYAFAVRGIWLSQERPPDMQLKMLKDLTEPVRRVFATPRKFTQILRTAADISELRKMLDSLEAAAPRGPAAPSWIGLTRDTHATQLADLQHWADTVLGQRYGGYELPGCWPRHIHAIWELSTRAAEWHHTYGGARRDLAQALEFHDRWLPGTMRCITGITRQCMPQCVMLRGHGDWAARPRYR